MPYALIRDNTTLLKSVERLLDRISSEAYAGSRLPGKAGIGPHVRHALDHYQCLLEGISSGFIDYDHRERLREIESDRAAAVACIERMLIGMESLIGMPLHKPLKVRMDSGKETDRETNIHPSSLGRELQFLVSHTVHHFAIIDLHCSILGVEVPEGFGVAPSTLRHREQLASE